MDQDLSDGVEGVAGGAAPVPLQPVDEEEEQLMRNFGSNALMSRVQDALRKQLEEQLARVEAVAGSDAEGRAVEGGERGADRSSDEPDSASVEEELQWLAAGDRAGRDELGGGVWLLLARQTQRTQRDSKLLRPASHRS